MHLKKRSFLEMTGATSITVAASADAAGALTLCSTGATMPSSRPLPRFIFEAAMADRRRESAGRRVAQLAVEEMIAERLADQKAAHRAFAGNGGNA